MKKIVALGQHMNSLPFVNFCIDVINFYIHIFISKYENITPIKIFIVENIEIFLIKRICSNLDLKYEK